MEDSLILVVAELEVFLRGWEDFRQCRDVIVLQSVIQWQVSVVVSCVWPWLDFVNNASLLVDAGNVLDRLSLVILLATSHVERVVFTEPVEDVLIAESSAFEERILAVTVFLLEGLASV